MDAGMVVLNALPPASAALAMTATVVGWCVIATTVVGMVAVLLLVWGAGPPGTSVRVEPSWVEIGRAGEATAESDFDAKKAVGAAR